jgi:tRNA(Ile)-lysidine synthase
MQEVDSFQLSTTNYQLPTILPTTNYQLETILAAALEECPPGAVLLASVSGGADSTAMLAALAAIRDCAADQYDFELRCIHIEHGIRRETESRGDAAFVRSLCQKLNVPCAIVSIKPGKIQAVAKSRGMGIEAAARLYRRRAWSRQTRRLEAEGHEVRILVAHTADDMRETVLMRIFRGSGPSGLAAMPSRRGRILRPLLTANRRDVLDYLAEKKLSWREDSTNTDIQFLRNRIRHCLIPQLNELFPQWKNTITALAETQSLAAAFIREEAARRIKWVPSSIPYQLLTTNYQLFSAEPAIIREEALFQGINQLGLPARIKRKNIRRFAAGCCTVLDLGQLRIKRDSRQITLFAVEKDDSDEFPSTTNYQLSTTNYQLSTINSKNGFSLLIYAPGSYNLKGIAIEVTDVQPADNHQDVFISLLPLVFRPRFNGDSIEQNGRDIVPAADVFADAAVFAALDALGTVAFVGPDGLLAFRDAAALQEALQTANKKCCAVRVIPRKGKTDV